MYINTGESVAWRAHQHILWDSKLYSTRGSSGRGIWYLELLGQSRQCCPGNIQIGFNMNHVLLIRLKNVDIN